MKFVFIFLLLFAPAPPPRLVPIQNGIVVIVWENDGADTVLVDDTDNAECRIVAEQGDLFLGTVLTQAPMGPPYEARCAIRPGDRLYLLRYRERRFLGRAGPFVVPMRVWLPMVRQ